MSDNEEPIRLSLARTTVPVILDDGEGHDVEYCLKELTGRGRDIYMKAMTANVQFDTDGKPSGFTAPTGLATKLVGLCLFKGDKRAGDKVVEDLPARVVNELFMVAKRISAINLTAAKVEAGND